MTNPEDKLFTKAVTIELDTYRRVRGKPGQVKTVTRTTVGVGSQQEDGTWVVFYAGTRGAIYESRHTDPSRVWVCRALSLSAKPMILDRAAIRFSDFRDATDADRKAVFGD